MGRGVILSAMSVSVTFLKFILLHLSGTFKVKEESQTKVWQLHHQGGENTDGNLNSLSSLCKPHIDHFNFHSNLNLTVACMITAGY